MSRQYRWTAVQKFMMSLWAMTTLILLFLVILLVREIAANGRDPLGALEVAESSEGDPVATPRTSSLGTREVQLYFAAPDGQSLAPEARVLPFSESVVENCRTVVTALIEGPRTELTPVLPPTARLKSVFLLEQGELVINFSRELQTDHPRSTSAAMESLLVQGIVQSVSQAALDGGDATKVRRVRFLIDDAPPTEAFPAHIDLGEPIAPDPRWLAARN